MNLLFKTCGLHLFYWCHIPCHATQLVSHKHAKYFGTFSSLPAIRIDGYFYYLQAMKLGCVSFLLNCIHKSDYLNISFGFLRLLYFGDRAHRY